MPAVILGACETSRAQTTSWAAAASGNWTTAASWNPAFVPGDGTNAAIVFAGTCTVTYNSPMPAASIASLTLGSATSLPTLTITAAGFNVTGVTTLVNSGAEVLNINSGGVMTNGTNSDKVVVSGDLVLGGQLNITNAGGFGTGTYTLFTYGGVLTSGNLIVASESAGFLYTINTNTTGQIKFIVTSLQFNLINAGTSGLAMSGSGGPTNGTYYFLGATNIALPLNLWTRLATNQFDASGNFNFTNAISLNSPQKFYRLQLPCSASGPGANFSITE